MKQQMAEALPTKGKPTMFFYVHANANGNPRMPSPMQIMFVNMHYPQYSANQVKILDWLYAQGYENDRWLKLLN
jgi:hypothetical protein